MFLVEIEPHSVAAGLVDLTSRRSLSDMSLSFKTEIWKYQNEGLFTKEYLAFEKSKFSLVNQFTMNFLHNLTVKCFWEEISKLLVIEPKR